MILRLRGCGVSDFVAVLPVPPQTEVRHGILRFIGPTEFDTGQWVGIELVGCKGHNDGSVRGKSYFHCPPGQGVFVRPEVVVPCSPDAGGGACVKRVDLFATLRDDITSLQTELQRKEDALQVAGTELRKFAALVEERTSELHRERKEKEQAALIPLRRNMTDVATEMVDGNGAETEVQRLQQQIADLKELCDIQEEELHRQKEHGDDLAQLVEDMRCEYNAEREELQEKIRSLEATLVQQREEQSLKSATVIEEVTRDEVESLRLQLFQQQQQKEAMRLLKQRYDELHAERERERRESEERWKSISADYEEALAQQREYKKRLLDETRTLQQQIAEMSKPQERDRALQTPPNSAEWEKYKRELCRMQWELMQVYGDMFAKRYDQFLAPSPLWKLSATSVSAISKEIASAVCVLPFTTPDICLHSRTALFQPGDGNVKNSHSHVT